MRKAVVCVLLLIGLLLPFAAKAKAYGSADFIGMMQTHPAVMLLVDPYTGEIKYANTAAAQYYGYSVKQFEEMNFSEINAAVHELFESNLSSSADSTSSYFEALFVLT